MSNLGRKKRDVNTIFGIEPKLMPIIEFVANRRGLTYKEIKQKRRFEELVQARAEVAYVIYYFFKNKISLNDISSILDMGNHTTIHHLIKKVDDDMSINKKYKLYIQNLLGETDIHFNLNSENLGKGVMLKKISYNIIKNKQIENEYKRIMEIQGEFNKILTIRDSLNTELLDLYNRIVKEYGE